MYKYEDRTNPVKAREMVEVIQGHYNPERDIRKAIRIHSIGFSKEAKWLAYADRYEAKVMKIVNEISEISNKNYRLMAYNNKIMKNGVLQEAIKIRSGERNADYGNAVENFRRITEIANAITGLTLTSIQICKIMIAVKLARERHHPKRDNRVDLCGYTDILDLLEESEIVE